MKSYVLVVDDEPDIRNLVKDILEDEGYQVAVAENAAMAREAVYERCPDLILLDIWMPDMDGISLLKEFITAGMTAPVVMVTGHGTVETAVEATRLGAFDFIEKPLSLGKLLLTVQRALVAGQQGGESRAPLRQKIPYPWEPVGKSVVMQNFRDQITRIAGYNTWVLLYGEPGSGKELFAHSMHNHSARRDGPFISVRVASVMEGHAGVSLFGDANAGGTAPGYLEQANGGTLAINDIADLDLSTQAKLLDVLITHSFKRIGGSERKEIDVRIVAGTKYNLLEAVRRGRFREDLFFRINEIPVRIPPLREHCEDIPELLQYYTDLFVQHDNLPYRKFSVAAQNWLRNYHWPGNVLELRNLVQRLLIVGNSDEISLAEVEVAIMVQFPGADLDSFDGFDLPLRQARERFEKNYLEHHLRRSGGNVGMVAKQAGIERTHLYRKFRALDIDPRNVK